MPSDPAMPHAAIKYLFTETPSAGETLRVAPGIEWMRLPLPFALDHVNAWLLDDGEGRALIDTGLGHDDTEALWEHVLTTQAITPSRLIITHGHPDHIGLAARLQEKHAMPLHMSQGEFLFAHALWHQLPGYCAADMVAQFLRHGLDPAHGEALAVRGNIYARLVPTLPGRFRRLFDGDLLTIGANDWRVIIGYGHSPEHVSLYCEPLGVLVSGDMLLPRISTNISVYAAMPEDDPLAWFLASLSRLKDLPPDTLVLPSHGRPFRGLKQRIEQLERHHVDRCDDLLAALETPRQAGEVLSTLFPRELDTHQLMFAMGEAIAHLNYLTNKKQVRRRMDENGQIRFERIA